MLIAPTPKIKSLSAEICYDCDELRNEKFFGN